MSVTNKAHSFPAGMTVRDLKKIIAEWPEEKEDGTLTEVWVEHDGGSNQVRSLWSLDMDSKDNADVLLDTSLA